MNWDQLKTILWLRWRLIRNQWTRSKGITAFLGALLAVAAMVACVGSFFGGLFGGIFGLAKASSTTLWVVWLVLTLGFLFSWMVGMLQEIQRSETIDLQRLMHLPVSLGQIFIINYLASHFALSIILVVPAMMGLALGLSISRGPAMLLLIPLALSMVCMITAWTYCLRGWLAALMTNPRRRRSIVMAVIFAFVLLGQLPNLYFNVFLRFNNSPSGANGGKYRPGVNAQINGFKEKYAQFRALQKFVPPLWLPLGAQELAGGNPVPALLGTLGCFGIGALGLRRSYQGTLKFYRGEPGGKATARAESVRTTAPTPMPANTGARFLELRLPFVPEQAAALALATFRSLLRAPEVKMAWGSAILVPLFVSGSILWRANFKIPETTKPFAVTGAVVFAMFFLVQFFSNQFGFDREGFRALVLSPADRSLILLGKNLACLPVGAGFGGVLLLLISLLLHLGPSLLAASLFQLVAVFLCAALGGNLLSIIAPFRIQPGTMRATKMPAKAVLILVACQLLFPIVMAPVFVPPLAGLLWHLAGGSDLVPVNLLLSAGLAALAALVYQQALPRLGRLLQRRETAILAIVTVEVD